MSDDLRDTLFPSHGAPIDPIAMARRDLAKALPRRFYTHVAVAPAEGGFALLLDGKPVRTPAKAALVVPTEGLAEALAAEWRAQGAVIEPATMPMTRLANSAIDGVSRAMEATRAEVAKFAETDLVCYRAGTPEALVVAQAEAWDPFLDFARDALGARLVCVEGVMYASQPAPALDAIRRAVAQDTTGAGGPLKLAALSVMTSLLGSIVMALAVARRAVPAETAWTAAHVDEDHQIAHWGADAEATGRRALRWRDMAAAAAVYDLVNDIAREPRRSS